MTAALIHSPPTDVQKGPHAVGVFGTRSSHPWALDVRQFRFEIKGSRFKDLYLSPRTSHLILAPDGPEHVGAKDLSPHSPSGPPNAKPIRTVVCKNQPLRMVLASKWIKAADGHLRHAGPGHDDSVHF